MQDRTDGKDEVGSERAMGSLYQTLLAAWNRRSALEMGVLFTEDANMVGFDSSQLNGRPKIESHLGRIFADHPTSAYVGKVREVRFLTPGVAVLRAAVGMVPPGQADLNPAVNAVQTLVASKSSDRWLVAVFQSTPAAFHGRPEEVEQLTAELRLELKAREGP